MTSRPPIAEEPLRPRKAAVVVGASRGFGAALARRLAAEGYDLALLSRQQALLRKLADEIEASSGMRSFVYRHDVKDVEEVPDLLQRIARDLGRLDLFIYSAGIMYKQDPEAYEVEQDLETLRVNLLGAAAWLLPVAHRFARAGAGHIVAVGSIAGDRGRRALPGYSASKAGLDTYLEALRNRLTRFGVTVTTLKPGQIRTSLLEKAAKERGPIEPDRAAELAWRAIKSGKQVAYLPSRWALVGLTLRHIPSFIFRRMDL
jgi:short-subunit dehydrogenase